MVSRTKLIEYAEKHQIPVPKDKRGEAPFSQDANLLHISSEGKILEDPWNEPDFDLILTRMVTPEAAPDKATEITMDFVAGQWYHVFVSWNADEFCVGLNGTIVINEARVSPTSAVGSGCLG